MPRQKGDSWQYFAMILYPDDSDHVRILDYIKNNRVLFVEYAYILHDQDEIEEEEIDTLTDGLQGTRSLKKDHYHMIVRYYTHMSNISFLASWKGALSKTIGIKDYKNYIQYMLHQNWDAILKNKYVYNANLLRGTTRFVNSVDNIQNTNFVQFYDIVQQLRSTPDCSINQLLDQVRQMPVDEMERIMDILHKESYLIKSAAADAQYLIERGMLK